MYIRRATHTLRMVGFSLLLFLAGVTTDEAVGEDRVSVDIGPQQTVIPVGHRGLHCFSDEPISILSAKPLAFYVVNTNRTELLQGTSFESAVPIKVVLEPAGGTAFDSSYAGVSAIYQGRAKNELLAFYHAEDDSNMGKIEYNPLLRGAHWSVGLAISRDGGQTLERAGQIITSSQKKDLSRADMHGLGDPSVCVDKTGEFLLAYYTDLSQMPRRAARICMARSRIADGGRPGTWKKFFKGQFSEDGLGGQESDIIADAFHPNVTYVKAMDKYIMFMNVADWPEHQRGKADQSGFYFSTSEDGVAWSEPWILFGSLDVPLVGKEYAGHPYFHLQSATARSAAGWLFYAYSPRWGPTPNIEHFLVKRPVRITISQRDGTPRAADKPAAFVFSNRGFIVTPLKRFSPCTLEAWVKPRANPKDVFVFGSMSSAIQSIGLGLNNGVLRAQYLFGDIGSAAVVPPDRWSHIAAVYDNDSTRLYLNGQQVSKGPANVVTEESPNFVLGAIGKGLLENCFEGQVRAVRISKGARFRDKFSPDETFVVDPKGNAVRAVLIYDASQTESGEATDLSGSGNHGRLSNVSIEEIRD